ncbi:MAG: hypothetical protein ACK4E0_06790 [Chitinophagaceae bacterium]
MRKLFLGLALGLAVISVFAFTNRADQQAEVTDMYFLYELNDVPTTDDNFEEADNWIFSSTQPSACSPIGSGTCFIKVSSADLTGSGTEEERLVDFLIDQGDPGTPYANAREAVAYLRQATKLSNID